MFLRVLILMIMTIMMPFAASAAERVNDFQIKVLPAEGQKSFSEGYFNLDAELGQNLSLEFRVTNNSEKKIDLLIKPVDAYTADKGGILYSDNLISENAGHVRMTELISVQESLSIAPGDEEIVHFHIATPLTAEGTILGGVMLSTRNSDTDLSMDLLNKGGSNYAFEQTGQRLIAVKLNLPEKSTSGFSVDKAKFNSEFNQVTIKMKNSKTAVIENVQGTYTVLDKEGETVVGGVIKSFAMAPESTIDFPIDLKGKLFEKGKYVLMLKGRAGEKEFLVEEKFAVTENREAGISSISDDASGATSREEIPRILAISLAILFLLLPLLLKVDKKMKKRAV